MSATAARSPIDVAYQTQRLRLAATVAATAARAVAHPQIDAAVAVIPIVEAGQAHIVTLVDAYMAAKTVEATGRGTVVGLDPANYTISALRNGADPAALYARALAPRQADDPVAALEAVHASLAKVVRTDLQLAQTHSARDWMVKQAVAATRGERIVGYRRVLTGPGPHCALCEAAATRTYRASDLMPIHEHCGCTVEPLWGEHSVSSIGTTVRVENDPEIGPRLMADGWSSVGPRLL